MKRRVALLALVVLLLGAPVALAASAYVHGRIEADNVAGYTVRLYRWTSPYWEKLGRSTTNTSGQWGIGATVAGRYKAHVEAAPSGGRMIGARYPGGLGTVVNMSAATVEFNVGASGNVGDVVFIWLAETGPTATATPWPTLPVPTTLMPPTVNPTATPSGWRRPYGVISWFGTWAYGTDAMRSNAVGFLQLSEMWQWNVIEKARQEIGGPLRYLLDVKDDPLWLSGADMELGAQLTPRFEIGPYEAMGFCQAIIVRER